MKTIICTLFLSIGIITSGYSQGNDSLGLPGDNLDLYSVLELFKKSDSPEAFEAALNKEGNKVNNLDLNGDGQIDYIRVIDHLENGAHALILQIPINENEAQDVAVIELDKNEDGTAHIQIVGDEDLYGKDYIIEPMQQEVSKNSSPSQSQPVASSSPNPPVIVNVWAWPSVRYVYGPKYSTWVSPYRWSHYPMWWKPWRPYRWNVYHTWGNPYHGYHQRVAVYHVVRAHAVYRTNRVVSKTVYQRRAPGVAPARAVQQGPRAKKQYAPREKRAVKQNKVHQKRVRK